MPPGRTSPAGTQVGTVVGNTTPHEFQFFLRRYAAKLGDLVSVGMEIPESNGASQRVTAWARIVELGRFNPFLPTEAGQELAEEGLRLTDTVLSVSRDQIEGKALVLGYTDERAPTNLRPLNYPINPGGEILPPPDGNGQSDPARRRCKRSTDEGRNTDRTIRHRGQTPHQLGRGAPYGHPRHDRRRQDRGCTPDHPRTHPESGTPC